ncbi:MAG: nucleoside triphosphate pyrophosphohydrolase family protein [Myxococcota bacterium]
MSRTGSERDLLANGALGLAGEAGEAADLIKKHLFHDHPLDRDKLRDELGDVLWYVATLARTLDLDLAQVAQRNIDKLRIRYPEGFSAERSRNRSLTRKETPHAE